MPDTTTRTGPLSTRTYMYIDQKLKDELADMKPDYTKNETKIFSLINSKMN